MAKDPAFLFYPNDFLSGTQFMSDDQVGKYMRILMAQHQHGHLTEEQVIFISKSHDKHIFSKLKQDSAGLWFNERLEIEINKRKNFVLSRSKNKEGKTKEKITSKSHDLHVVNRNVNEDVNEDWLMWGDKIVEGTNILWDKKRGRKISREEMAEFLSVAVRNEWVMKTEMEFIISLDGFKSINQKIISNGKHNTNSAEIIESKRKFAGQL